MSVDFEAIVLRCDGMLSPTVYARIYEAARRGGTIVEVGTALGAGTVALALGLRDSGRAGRVFSFDPMAGGPRQQAFSGADARTDRIHANLAHFGVDHLVDIVASALPDGLGALPAGAPVSVLMLDADGRIDRDLIALGDRIQTGAPVIIDDYADKVRISRGSDYRFHIDSKMRLTFLLVNALRDAGFLSEGDVERNTWFGEKRDTNGTPFPLPAMLGAYRQLVFTRARMTPADAWRRKAILMLERTQPALLQRLRVWKRRRGTPG